MWDFVIIHYTKYELANPCGNDANTVLSMQFDPLAREKHVWLPALVSQWYKRKKPREFKLGHARSYLAWKVGQNHLYSYLLQKVGLRT